MYIYIDMSRFNGWFHRKISKACVGEFSENREERLEQIIVVAGRCSDYELLTVNAVVEGQSETWKKGWKNGGEISRKVWLNHG